MLRKLNELILACNLLSMLKLHDIWNKYFFEKAYFAKISNYIISIVYCENAQSDWSSIFLSPIGQGEFLK